MIVSGSGRPFTVGAARILLRIKAKPGAREDRILGVRNGDLLVSVRAAPEGGKANEAIIKVLADALDLRKSDIILKAGAGSSHKTFELPLSCMDSLKKVEET
jgi:uncharacterized protein YggU (UPF0235/DUF167 family)